MVSTQPTLIFDFDGTIADTLPVYLSVLERFTQKSIVNQIEQLPVLRQMPLQKVFGYLKASRMSRLRVLWFHMRHMPTVIGEAPMWDNMQNVLETLQRQGYRLDIVSSNYERNVRAFLNARKIERYFQDIRHVASSAKAEGLRHFVQQKTLSSNRTFYVGNEPGDIKAAHLAGIKSVGVLWSGQDHQRMAAEQPTTIARQPQDLLGLFGR